jgi:hypothetical protein
MPMKCYGTDTLVIRFRKPNSAKSGLPIVQPSAGGLGAEIVGDLSFRRRFGTLFRRSRLNKHKEKFGTFPPFQSAEPLPPDEATRSWVSSRQIASAKSAERRSA